MKTNKHLNNKKESTKVKMSILHRMPRILGVSQNFINGVGLGLIILGIYLFFAGTEVIPFSPRFDFLDSKTVLITGGILLAISGVLLNEKIRRLFK